MWAVRRLLKLNLWLRSIDCPIFMNTVDNSEHSMLKYLVL